MAKASVSSARASYVCSSCGAQFSKWLGRCSECSEWNTVSEQIVDVSTRSLAAAGWTGQATAVRDLRSVQGVDVPRISTGLAELDRVLGGGVVPGSVILLGGDPGVGKSTLLLQVCAHLGATERVLYVTGEESDSQVALRAHRMGLADANIRLHPEVQLELILDTAKKEQPAFMVVDSIQTVFLDALQASAGSVSQVRECASSLTRLAKSAGVAVVLVGHVTKEGTLAGPRVLEHMVDTVLYFEGEQGSQFRMVRALKNRFGAVNELGVFAMGGRGLEEVSNPSSMFLTAHESPVPGVCTLAAMEGNRPFLVEVQALVEDAPTLNAKRSASGVDTNRLQMLLAVLHGHAAAHAFDKNVYVKIVGGVKMTEPAADLALLFAVHSSLSGKPVPTDVVAFGEVGLAGEVRAVPDGQTRLQEAAKLGFRRAVVPAQCAIQAIPKGIEVFRVPRIDKALEALRSLRNS